jgi:hypothetical protein
MSNTPPKRSQLASSQKPHADSNWPPTDEELAQSNETVQRLYRCLDWRPTDDEPVQSSVETLHSAVEKPHPDCNWPPTDEEPADGGIEAFQSETVFDGTGVKTAEPLVARAATAPAATSAVPPGTPTQLPTAAIRHETSRMPADRGRAMARDEQAAMFNGHAPEASPDASSEPWEAWFADEVATPSEAEHPEYAGMDASSDIAVAQNETALDETSAGDWAAEIARLQALIEGLTEKVEWRITNGSGH